MKTRQRRRRAETFSEEKDRGGHGRVASGQDLETFIFEEENEIVFAVAASVNRKESACEACEASRRPSQCVRFGDARAPVPSG